MDTHAKEEYEIQFYGFAIKELQKDTERIIKKRASEFVSSLFRTLAKRDLFDVNDTKLNEVREQTTEIIYSKIKNYIKAIQKQFAYYYAIPDNIVLIENIPHEKYCNGQYDISALKNKVNTLEMELLQMKLFRQKLEAELEYHKKIDKFIVDEEAMIGIVKSILSEQNLTNECQNEIMLNRLKQINGSLLKK